MQIVGFGRSPVADDDLRKKIKEKLPGTEEEKAKFLKCVCYHTKILIIWLFLQNILCACDRYSCELHHLNGSFESDQCNSICADARVGWDRMLLVYAARCCNGAGDVP
jgi:hypothetical protein